jgi:adenylate cyclase
MVCNYLFARQGWVLNMVYPEVVVIMVYVGITAYRFFIESRQKAFIRDAFSTYLAPSVVKDLLDSPDKLVLGGEERTITAFFSDVQGFTSISESLNPAELVELLNEFLTEMTDIILHHQGTVDKFEGDAIIAMFGAPNVIEEQEKTACRACIEMQQRLAELRRGWSSQGRPLLNMRIGMCTGPAVVGNMGSKSRMDYTMMGDTVNTAARLEGVNKVYGIYSLISESTFRGLDESILTREIDSIKVVGKTEPVSIYEIIGYTAEANQKTVETLSRYASGLSAYRQQKWGRAASFFKAALNLSPDDGPSKAMIKRCLELKTNPPGATWDGSFSMTKK